MALPLPSINAVYRNDNVTPLIVTCFLIVSVSAVFINKYLTTASEYKFSYSSVTVLFQQVIALLSVQLWRRCQSRLPGQLRLDHISTSCWRKVVPCACIYVMMMILDPLFLTRVPVTMYASTHGFSIITTLITTMIIGLNGQQQQQVQRRGRKGVHPPTIDRAIAACCIVQYLGVWLSGSTNGLPFILSWISLCYPIMITLYAVCIQKALIQLQYNVSQLLQCQLTLVTLFTFLYTILSGELATMYSSVLFLDEVGFCVQMLINSVLAMTIHILMIMLIKYTSPLTYVVTAIAKTCLQALAASFVFRNTMTGYQFICLSVSLLAAACYSRTSTPKTVDAIYSM